MQFRWQFLHVTDLFGLWFVVHRCVFESWFYVKVFLVVSIAVEWTVLRIVIWLRGSVPKNLQPSSGIRTALQAQLITLGILFHLLTIKFVILWASVKFKRDWGLLISWLMVGHWSLESFRCGSVFCPVRLDEIVSVFKVRKRISPQTVVKFSWNKVRIGGFNLVGRWSIAHRNNLWMVLT